VQVTFSEAAKVLGMKSRSTLYRLKDSELARYVRPPARPGGAQMLELAPEGLPTLKAWLATILQAQSKTQTEPSKSGPWPTSCNNSPPPADLPALAFGAPSPAPSAEPVDPAAVAQGLAQLVAGLPEDAIPHLATSRERRAHYQAELARLQALEQRGDLLPKTEIMAAAFSVARTTRDMFLAMPSRLAPQLVGVADTPTAFALLDKEIRHALTYLADATERLGQ
jgi:hypothetical protein